MESTSRATAPSPAQPLSGQGVLRISPSSRIDSTTESTGSVDGSIGPVHDLTENPQRFSQTMEIVKPKDFVQKKYKDISTERARRRERNDGQERRGMDMFSGADRYDRHYVVKASDSTPLSTVNTIKAYEELKKQIVGVPKRIMERRDGGLSITVDNREQGEKLMKLSSLVGVSVEVTSDANLNRTQGTIRYENHPGFTTQELLEALKPQEVTDIYQLSKRNEDKTTSPLPLYILTFGTTKIPERVSIGWTSCSVRMYIPRPRRCFKCHRFGHGSNTCRSQVDICGKCSEVKHEGECTEPLCCVNCKGSHPSFTRACPAYQKEQEIIAYKVRNNTTYNEAKTIISRNYVRENTTYSQMLKRQQPTSVETTKYQTEQSNVGTLGSPDKNSREENPSRREQVARNDVNNNEDIIQNEETNEESQKCPKQQTTPSALKKQTTREKDQPKRQRESFSPPRSNQKDKPPSKEQRYPIKMNIPTELPKKKYKGNTPSSVGRRSK